MKILKHFKPIIYILASIAFFSSACLKQDFNEPKFQYPDTSFFKPVISIADLYQFDTANALVQIDTLVYLKATVIANDESGNYYKAFVVQDSTAGIQIDIRATGTYLKYPIGSLVFIKCQGLYLGKYGGVYKLGAEYNGGVGQIPEPLMDDYIFPSPGGKAIKPRVKKISDQFTIYDYNTLVKFENVQFRTAELDRTYADYINKVTSDVYITDTLKNTAGVRTSGYASFAANPIPELSGDITCVFNVYNSTKQLYIRDLIDVDFTKPRFGAWFEEEFNSNLGTFSPYSVVGNEAWTYSSQYDCALMSGFSSGNQPNEDWLISPHFDFSSFTTASLSFVHACYLYSTGTWSMLGVKVSDDYTGGDPNMATWTNLSGYTTPNNAQFTFENSGNLDLSAFIGKNNVSIAFYYTSTSGGAPKWEISSVSINAK